MNCRRSLFALIAPLLAGLLLAAASSAGVAQAAEPRLELVKGDKIVIIGNMLAERMQYFGNFETLLQSRFPALELVVRNLGWSADELTLRPRSQDFQNHGHRMEDHQPSVVIAAFGFNESFAGPAGLEKFKADLDGFIRQTTTTAYNGQKPPRLVLLSPIANEDLPAPVYPAGKHNNANIKLYVDAMASAARQAQVPFVDLFAPTQNAMAESDKRLTINGIHLGEFGDRQVAALIDEALFGPRSATNANLDKLRAEVNEKNLQFFYDYRAVNGCYIYGGRKAPFGIVNFPAEFARLRKMIAARDRRVWAVAQGQSVPEAIDDSAAGEFVNIESNVKEDVKLTTPAESMATFKLPEGYEVNLFASEIEFPDLKNPVASNFDARGRLWVCTMPTYPMYLPGTPVNDKILILEDTDHDGRADKQTVFADGLHLPTGFELGDGGVYVGQEPNLVFLGDGDGDDRADSKQIVLGGFDSADSHHALHAFTWDPGGGLHFQEGIFHFTQVESPTGPVRNHDAGIYRYEPKTRRFSLFTSHPFYNPWGHYVDRWGQDFVADASDGSNYYGTAFSGDTDYPDKHNRMQTFLKMQWRPTCGCELVSSRNFPDEAQGNYLLNNCIGFQGVLQYKVHEEGSGFAAEPIEPLLQSSDRNFRPSDMEFGPDGALYLVDWFNPLIGHMQHSLRDPKRDTSHGRIWRIRYAKKPLLDPAAIAGEPISVLLDLLKAYEDRTRYRARVELRSRDTDQVLSGLSGWVDGLAPQHADYWHHLTEALWLRQAHDAIDPKLLEKVLRCPEPHARAAATRVLCYWRDRIPGALDLLAVQAGDEHPRVRLEAVRAASYFHGDDVPRAQEVALESLVHPQDYYLKYTLDETNRTLDKRMKK